MQSLFNVKPAQQRADLRRSRRVVERDKYPKGGTLYDTSPQPVSKLKSAEFGDDNYFHPQSRLCPESKQSAPVNKSKLTRRMDPEDDNYFVSISRLCPEPRSKKVEKEIVEISGELDRTVAKLTPLLESDEITQQEFDYNVNCIRAQLQMTRRKTQECEKAKNQKQPLDDKCISKWGLSKWSVTKKRPNLDRPAPKYRFQFSSEEKTFVASKVRAGDRASANRICVFALASVHPPQCICLRNHQVRCKAGTELKPLTIPVSTDGHTHPCTLVDANRHVRADGERRRRRIHARRARRPVHLFDLQHVSAANVQRSSPDALACMAMPPYQGPRRRHDLLHVRLFQQQVRGELGVIAVRQVMSGSQRRHPLPPQVCLACLPRRAREEAKEQRCVLARA